jgi:hypothetical protein
MKVAKMFSLDSEIVSRLNREDNASRKVNSILSNHYAKMEIPNQVEPDWEDKRLSDAIQQFYTLQDRFPKLVEAVGLFLAIYPKKEPSDYMIQRHIELLRSKMKAQP